MNYILGIDIGSALSKGVIISDKNIVAEYSCPSGSDVNATAYDVRENLILKAGISVKDIKKTVSTGYGAKNVPFADETLTDVGCHGRGIFSLLPSVRTVVDVGDIHSRAIRINEKGHLQNFILSGKCAGGSGRVLRILAKVLRVDVMEMGELSLKSKNRIEFSTGCAVFAESEAISRIAEGAAKEDLLAGIHRALASQLHSLSERLRIEQDYAITGGWGNNVGLVKALNEISGIPVFVPPKPHLTAAYGAALAALPEL